MTRPAPRVLHVGKYYPPVAGGIEYFLADLLKALERHGVRTAALVHNHLPGGVRPDPDDKPLIYRTPAHGQFLYTPLSPSFPLWLHRAIRDFKPDILHLHLPNVSAFAALALPAARRLPWVTHWHSDVEGCTIDRRLSLAYRLYRPLERRILERSRIIATSPPYLASSPTLSQWNDHSSAIPLGIDPERLPEPDTEALAWAESLWGGRETGRILSVGRLAYYKGHDILIQATERIKDAKTVIVGSGPFEERLRTSARRLKIEDRITLVSNLDWESHGKQLSALYATSDLLCLPSLERTESFGLVQLEAMRFGKPVVVSDIPGSGAGWVATEAGCGITVPPGDTAALAVALRSLLEDTGACGSLGARGHQSLLEQFHIDHVAGQITAEYKRMLSD